MLMVERPNRVRLDAMTPFGPAAVLTSNGERFALTDFRSDRFMRGQACPENIARLLGIPFSGEQVAAFLLGNTPRLKAQSQTIECTGEGTYRVALHGADGYSQEIDLDVRDADRKGVVPDQQRLRLVRSELYDPGGRTVWRVELSDYRIVEDPRSDAKPRYGVAMPFEMHFWHARKGADAVLKFERVELNVSIPAEAFDQENRPGMRSEEVRCH
jgi:hypothetical protein